MPPEPLPWDRKDNFRDKKHERSDGVGSVARWRDSPREFRRWGSDDFRRPQGHGKQGGYQIFAEDSGHGCMPFRASERMVGDENSSYRSSAARGDGKYGRNAREIKGSFSQKDSKRYLWESGDTPVNSLGRHHDLSAQRSVTDLLTYSPHPQSDIENSSWDHHLHFKNQHDKMATVDALPSVNRYDKDQSLGPIGWKPMKWNRSGSLSSRGSGFSHTSSSRSMGADSDETKPDSVSGRVTPVQSPSGDAAVGVAASNAAFEDTCARKKQRLGWGQGLAKYEKQKVEGSDETLSKNGLVPCSNIAKPSASIPSFPDKSPRVTGLSECASPVTTSSVACSSSPDLDDKPHIKAGNNDIDMCNLNGSPGHEFQSCLEEFSASLEHLSSSTNLSSMLSDLLQPEDACSGDSNFAKSTAMNKLMLLKSEVSKALEKTEFEIDLSENGLKLLNSESETKAPHLLVSDSLQVECTLRPHEGAVSNVFQKPVPLQIVSSSNMLLDTPTLCDGSLQEVNGEVKDDDIDSPGTATSKFVEPSCMEKAACAFSTVKHDDYSTEAVAARSAFSEQQCVLPSIDEEKLASVSCSGDGYQQTECGIVPHAPGDLSPECKLNDLILVSNMDSARKAFEVFSRLLPTDRPEIDIWGSCNILCKQNNSLVKEKLATRKFFQRFKERVLTLKFRALQYLWKEDLRLLSIRKYKAKSQKRIESSSRTSHIVYQKHRSSIRSRFALPAGSLTLVPTSEIVDFTSKLLADSQIKLYRTYLKMPALVDEKEKRTLRFVTSNGLVEDPCSAEKERVMVNPWTPKEKDIFLDMLGTFGKDFKKIASYLDHKTTADCVEFYYKNHKSESFEKVKKKSELRKQERCFPTNTYLVTSGKKWNREVNAASLDLLGAASEIAAHVDNSLKTQHTYMGRHYQYKTCWGNDVSYERASSIDILGNEREAAAADTLAGICGALSSEAMSSCITSSVDPGESCQEEKFQKNFGMDCPLTPKFMQNIDDEETCSDESCGELDSVDWTDEEKSNFVGALRSYGKDFVKISRCVRSKSRDQCKIFFSKARKSLSLDVVPLGSGNEDTPVSDATGGRSDTEDAGVFEMESAICSTQSCSKMDIDLPLSMMDANYDASEHAGTNLLQADELDISGEKNGVEQYNHLQIDEPGRSGEKNGMKQSNHNDGVTGPEALLLDECRVEDKPDLAPCGWDSSTSGSVEKLEGASKVVQPNDAIQTDATLTFVHPVVLHADSSCTNTTECVKQQRTDQTTTPNEISVSADEPGVAQSISVNAMQQKVMPGSSSQVMTESGQERFLVPEGTIECSRNVKTGVDTNNSKSSSSHFVLDSKYSQVPETIIQPSFSLTPNHQPQIPLEFLPSVQKSQIITWKQKENSPVSGNSMLQDSSLIHYEDHLRQVSSSSTLNFEGTGNDQHQKPVSADIYQRYLLCHHSLNRVEPSQILRGYPLQVLNKKEINGHVNSVSSEKQSILPNSKVNGSFQSGQFLGQDFHREKCNGSKLPQSLAELPLMSKSHDQSTSCHTRSHSQGSSDTEEHSHRIGDVKLFGQILSNSSTSQKPNVNTPDTDSKGASQPMSSSKSFNLKFTTDQGADRALMSPQLDANMYSGLDDFPARSYGFWDGSRIQTGFPSLPDSSILLAKYPAAFTDYSTASPSGDQQSLPAVVKRNDRNLGSLSVYPAKDVSGGSMQDYQVYRSYDGAKLQPFTVDMKRHDAFSELQKRNGFEMSSFQKQARGVVGMNVVGTSIMVGGGCPGISDPVAAIKMHYATTERYGGQSGSTREEDSWRGDIGR